MAILFYVMKVTIGLRVFTQEEMEGLGLSEHGTVSYPKATESGTRILMLSAGD